MVASTSSGHLLDFGKQYLSVSRRRFPIKNKPLKASSRTSQRASQSSWRVTAPKRGIYGVGHGSSPRRAIAEPSARSGGSVWSFSTPGRSRIDHIVHADCGQMAPETEYVLLSFSRESDFEFEADLHNPRARDLEIGAWSLCVVMHECKNLFAPARHAQPLG
jgi:hypothetical protein